MPVNKITDQIVSEREMHIISCSKEETSNEINLHQDFTFKKNIDLLSSDHKKKNPFNRINNNSSSLNQNRNISPTGYSNFHLVFEDKASKNLMEINLADPKNKEMLKQIYLSSQ